MWLLSVPNIKNNLLDQRSTTSDAADKVYRLLVLEITFDCHKRFENWLRRMKKCITHTSEGEYFEKDFPG